MKISVAMAYYNGGTYIEEQMDSILSQLGEKDEVIVSVDGASDGSKPLLLKMAEVDSRIHIVKGPGKGVVRNFENAIRHCNGDIIYLSDQDDIWKPDKVEKVNYAFSNPKYRIGKTLIRPLWIWSPRLTRVMNIWFHGVTAPMAWAIT